MQVKNWTAIRTYHAPRIISWKIVSEEQTFFTHVMNEIISKTNEKSNINYAWNTDLDSSLWLWGGRLGNNLQFRTDYFSNFFNKVLLNTIQGSQVFCFVPLVQYHPKTVAAILDIQGYPDATDNRITNSIHASNIGYFPTNAGRIQLMFGKKISSTS